MKFFCTATFIFPPPDPVPCGADASGIVMSISGDLTTGTYWDLSLNTNNNPFTNPSLFPLEVGDAICVNAMGEVVSFTPCPVDSQFFIDDPSNPITNKFPGCNLTAELAQFLVNQNLINPNATITVTELETGELQVVVTIRDNVSHTIAGLQITVNDVPVFVFEAPFVCNIIRVKRKVGTAFGYIYCINKFDSYGRQITPPPFIRSNGKVYGNPVDRGYKYCYNLINYPEH